MLNLATLLETSARDYAEKDAVVFGDTRVPYAALDNGARRVAGALAAMGVQPGDRVALSCPNLPYFPLVYFGICVNLSPLILVKINLSLCKLFKTSHLCEPVPLDRSCPP
jgi:acyl-CoA synthetase (AMP-forming)/AMP-acid ligase II